MKLKTDKRKKTYLLSEFILESIVKMLPKNTDLKIYMSIIKINKEQP